MKSAASLPRYAQLARSIGDDIRRGKFQPGERLPSFGALNTQHGLSQNTWDKMCGLLEKEGLVTRERRRGVFVAEPQKRASVGAIGVVMDEGIENEQRHPYYNALLSGIRAQAQRFNRELLFLHNDSAINFQKCDGLIVACASMKAIQPRLPEHMPIVSVLDFDARPTGIVSDDEGGIRQAVEHLLELGHRRIAGMFSHDAQSQARAKSYRQTLHAAGIEPCASWARPWIRYREGRKKPYFYHAGRTLMTRWLEEDWSTLGCTALLAQNDATAVGAIEVLLEAGIKVPDDVSVVGFDGAASVEYFRPRLTTIEVPLREIGARAVEVLVECIEDGENGSLPAPIVLPTHLKIGKSTAQAKNKNKI